MKRIIKRIEQILLCTLLAFIGVGCAKENQLLQGKWVQVNGETIIEIKGKQMKVSYGEWTDHYKYKIRTEYGERYVSNVKDGGCFGIMSELQLKEDGSLIGYAMIEDRDSLSYRFVKEEQLEEQYEIQDLSYDLPKVINSKNMEKFTLSFCNYGQTYGLDEEWETGSYSWVIEKTEDEKYEMTFMVIQDSYMAVNFREEVSEEYVLGLAECLKEHEVIENNGYYMKNNENNPGYFLYAGYESGEYVNISAEGGAADNCIFDIKALLDYASLQNLRYWEENNR